ncbi:MAG: metal-dependent transcriptional regulator [bacterium]|nr:metal-dependent transcriptional regulator [bacterium]
MDNKLVEEALSIIWEQFELVKLHPEKHPDQFVPISKQISEDVIRYMEHDGLIKKSGTNIQLTPMGIQQAISIIRRQRLAERLLVDILERPKTEVDSDACEFEHIISLEVEQSICTLLGHPQECPHGSQIPMGDCCRRAEVQITSIIVPLSRLSTGESGRVAYVLTQNHPEIHRLLTVGIVPGSKVRLHQTYPAYVIQVGEMQLAMEQEIAEHIYVRRTGK